jgi:phosphoribosyl-ATP pyrophosphohydrolase
MRIESTTMSEILHRLGRTIEARKQADPATSYVAHLLDAGLDQILKKVGEEAAETLIAAKGNEPDQVVRETADLWFHTLVMLAALDLGPEAVLDELERRFGRPGLEEKAGRS